MKFDRLAEDLKDSFNILRRNYKSLWIPILAEVLFLVLFGFFTGPLRNGIGNNLLQLGELIITESSNIGNDFFSRIIGSQHFGNIMTLGIIFALIAYVLYCLFQGFIWKFCFNFGKKEKYLPYIKRFFLVNLFWYPFFILFIFINFFFSYIDIVGQRMEPNSIFFLGKLTNIVLLAILYFAFISYVMIDKYKVWKSIRRSFKIGFREFLWMILIYLIIGGTFLVINYLLILVGKISFILVISLGIVIVIPLMIWARIFIREVVERL